MKIHFTRHAQTKFVVLKRHGVLVSMKQVKDTLAGPELVDEARLPLLIAQKSIDPQHGLRVAYKVEEGIIIVITFYPVRRKKDGTKGAK